MVDNVSDSNANAAGDGVQASTTPQDNNDWKAIAQSKQATADRYDAMVGKYGEDFEDKIAGFSEFEAQWQTDKESTVKRLAEQAGINLNQPQQPQAQPSQDELNVWELGQPDSKATKWLESKVDTISSQKAKEIAEGAIQKYEQQQQINTWRGELSNAGITNLKDQNDMIREYTNPTPPDFRQFLQGKVQPQGTATPRPSEVLRQVQTNQSQPQPTGVLQGGQEPEPNWEEEKVSAVMDIAKKKAGMQDF